MNIERKDIRGVTMTLTGGRLLLPNANIAEIITFAEPEPVPGAPAWILGRLRWRGWRLPLISFAKLAGFATQEGEMGAKVAVLRALGQTPRLPYFCLLTQGFPRLTTVASDALIPADEGELPPGALMRVLLRDEYSYIPDLLDIERRLVEELQLAA